jgi:dihydropteroate synthase
MPPSASDALGRGESFTAPSDADGHPLMARQLSVGGRVFDLGGRTLIMGVLNVTPDSFSGDGIYGDPAAVSVRAAEMVGEGADMIDIGGESTRPGAEPVGADEELRRVLPSLKGVLGLGVPVSVDTYKPEVASRALETGAAMINDVTGLRDPRMTELVADHGAAAVIMHMKGEPRTMQLHPSYPGGVLSEVKAFLEARVAAAESAGIRSDRIVIDPGIGFGKTPAHNLELLQGLGALKEIRKPILVGASRKGFLGKLAGDPADGSRLGGSVAAAAVSALNGADIVRVHDVAECRRALALVYAISRGSPLVEDSGRL